MAASVRLRRRCRPVRVTGPAGDTSRFQRRAGVEVMWRGPRRGTHAGPAGAGAGAGRRAAARATPARRARVPDATRPALRTPRHRSPCRRHPPPRFPGLRRRGHRRAPHPRAPLGPARGRPRPGAGRDDERDHRAPRRDRAVGQPRRRRAVGRPGHRPTGPRYRPRASMAAITSGGQQVVERPAVGHPGPQVGARHLEPGHLDPVPRPARRRLASPGARPLDDHDRGQPPHLVGPLPGRQAGGGVAARGPRTARASASLVEQGDQRVGRVGHAAAVELDAARPRAPRRRPRRPRPWRSGPRPG